MTPTKQKKGNRYFCSTYRWRTFVFPFLVGRFWIKFWDSRHIQVAIYTVFDEESEFQVKNSQILQPGGNN